MMQKKKISPTNFHCCGCYSSLFFFSFDLIIFVRTSSKITTKIKIKDISDQWKNPDTESVNEYVQKEEKIKNGTFNHDVGIKKKEKRIILVDRQWWIGIESSYTFVNTKI